MTRCIVVHRIILWWLLTILWDADIDLVFIWQRLNNGTTKGSNCLIKLAIHILSVIANSGGCKWSFSDFGITYTKSWNKLATEKVHKTTVIKTNLCWAHTAAGLTSKQWKCAFRQADVALQDQPPDSSSATSPLLVADEDVDVQDLMAELIRDANKDGNGDNGDNSNNDDIGPIQAVPPTHCWSCAAPNLTCITIFVYRPVNSYLTWVLLEGWAKKTCSRKLQLMIWSMTKWQ